MLPFSVHFRPQKVLNCQLSDAFPIAILCQFCGLLSGQLMEACRYVAQEIAGEWKRLYECLPFEPRREPDKLSHDIELIDIFSARRDKTDEEQALKSLEKWRTFSRKNCDVAQLIRGLRKLNKEELADNVEIRFSMESVYG